MIHLFRKIYLNNKKITDLDNYKKSLHYKKNKQSIDYNNFYPIFFTSCKTGYGINNLCNHLNNYFNKKQIIQKPITKAQDEKNVFIIQETYVINGVGMVFYGHMLNSDVYQKMIN